MKPPADPLNHPPFAHLCQQLRCLPAPEPSAQFTQNIMSHLASQETVRHSILGQIAKVAAALALLLAVYLIHYPRKEYAVSVDQSPIEILMAAQRTDGAWSAAVDNQPSRYDTGVTALAVLALIHSDSNPLESSGAIAIRSGIWHLLRTQDEQGVFASTVGSVPYNHYLATKAIETAAGLPGADPDWRWAARRAQKHLPPPEHLANLNRHLANPSTFPPRWAMAAGPSAQLALHLLRPGVSPLF